MQNTRNPFSATLISHLRVVGILHHFQRTHQAGPFVIISSAIRRPSKTLDRKNIFGDQGIITFLISIRPPTKPFITISILFAIATASLLRCAIHPCIAPRCGLAKVATSLRGARPFGSGEGVTATIPQAVVVQNEDIALYII